MVYEGKIVVLLKVLQLGAIAKFINIPKGPDLILTIQKTINIVILPAHPPVQIVLHLLKALKLIKFPIIGLNTGNASITDIK